MTVETPLSQTRLFAVRPKLLLAFPALMATLLAIAGQEPPLRPIADPGGPYFGEVGSPVVLDDSGSRGLTDPNLDWDWDLEGNGALVNPAAQPLQAVWPAPGSYRIALKVFAGGAIVPVELGFTRAHIVLPRCINDLVARPKLTKVQLTWAHQSGTVYNIYRSTSPWFECTLQTRIATRVITTLATYLDESVEVGLTYFYKVTRVANDAEVCISNEAVITSKDRTTGNTRPAANAGPDRFVPVLQAVQLDGTESFDAERNSLTYQWSFLSRPPGSQAVLSNPTLGKPAFTPDAKGDYILQLIVRDAQFASAPDLVKISTLNKEPDAYAGPDLFSHLGQTVVLDGTQSIDLDGDPLTFRWELLVKPPGSSAELLNSLFSQATLLPDVLGQYELSLIVHDGQNDSPPDLVRVLVQNRAPVANAGPDRVVPVGEVVLANGQSSFDPDGQSLSYFWVFTSKPPASAALLAGAGSVQASFLADTAGEFKLALIVNDGLVDSAPDVLSILADAPPVARAGPDQHVPIGGTVQLDGSASSDPEGYTLDYFWSFSSRPPTSQALLSDPARVNPTFLLDVKGEYVLQLVVDDGLSLSAPDTVSIFTANSPPIASAGPDQQVPVRSLVQLDGRGSSDIDADPLLYSWVFDIRPPLSAATLSDSGDDTPMFTADLPGNYVLRLIVHDGTVQSQPDLVAITTTNSPPVANAGPDQTVFLAQTVSLDGSGSSDVDGDTLTYSWQIVGKPAGSSALLSSETAVKPSLVIDLAGSYAIELTVNDGALNSTADTVILTTANSAPVANAGPDQTIFVSQTVSLDAVGSSDVDGDSLTYSWSFVSRPAGSGASLSDATASQPTFLVDLFGDYVVQLIVNDGDLDSAPDTITISTLNSKPIANAGVDQSVLQGDLVTLDGSNSSDVDQNDLTYGWSFASRPEASAATLSDPSSANPTFTADKAGLYVLQLIVNDGALASDPDTVSIEAAPLLVTVPNVVGLSQPVAQSTIATAQLIVGQVTPTHSPTVPSGQVISQSPVAGVQVAEGSAVDLNISLGPCYFPANPAGWTSAESGGSDTGKGDARFEDCVAILSEGDSYSVTLKKVFDFPESNSALTFTYSHLTFDTASQNTVKDAFEVALVDGAGNSLVHTISPGVPERDAFFNITESESISLGSSAQLSGNRVTLHLASIFPGTQGTLIFRLINNDADSATSVRISSFEIVSAPSPAPVAAPLSALPLTVNSGVDFSLLSDLSGAITPEYQRTSLREARERLFADVTLRNTGTFAIDGPLIAVFTRISDPSVRIVSADGFTPGGSPYLNFSSLLTDGTLPPGQVVGTRTLAFLNPSGVQFTFEWTFLGQLNHDPAFTSEPDTEALLNKEYRYTATASDPDGDNLLFTLLSAPTGMTLTPSGQQGATLLWTPEDTSKGNEQITLQVQDGRGGSALQNYTLAVISAPPNRPPIFTSVPVLEVGLSSPYSYHAEAMDPDSDPLSFTRIVAPDGLTINETTGLISWSPTVNQIGPHDVAVQVSDGRGGTATQSYLVTVLPDPSNHPPIISTQPVINATFGKPYSYDVDAIDPDNDDLTFSLLDNPPGMSIDPTSGIVDWLPAFTSAPPATPCAPPLPGLIHWWPGDLDGRDVIGNAHGVLEPGVTAGAPGRVAGAFKFTSSTGGVNLGNVPDLDFAPDSSFTIEAWFSCFGFSAPPNDGQQIVVLNYNCGATVQSLGFGNVGAGAGRVEFQVRDANGVSSSVRAAQPISFNKLYHVVAVRDISQNERTLRLYIDGVLVNASPDITTGPLALTTPDVIGRRNLCGTYNVLNGIIDEVAIYNRALSGSEAQGLFSGGGAQRCIGELPRITSCPIGQFAFIPAGDEAAVPDFNTGVIATGSGVITITQDPAPGTLVSPGTTTVTLTARDANGNRGSCQTFFTVIETSVNPTVRVSDGRGGFDHQSFTIELAPPGDLTIANIDTTSIFSDGQNLTATGIAHATIANGGTGAILHPFKVLFFEDRNQNGLFNPAVDSTVGEVTINEPLNPGGTKIVSVPLSGSISFPGSTLWALVDSGNDILETQEDNNVARTETDCMFQPQVGQFNPALKWKKNSFLVNPNSKHVMMAPVVIDVNRDGIPDVVFSTFVGSNYESDGTLRAISGDNGSEIWSVTDPAYEMAPGADLAAGDIDLDQKPEIIGLHESGRLIAFEHDGTFKWMSGEIWNTGGPYGCPSLADLDQDRIPEIIFGGSVLNSDGTIRWQGNAAGGLGRGGHRSFSAVADLNLDNSPDIVAGKSAYHANGSLYWNADIPDGYPAVGNFDGDPFPEIAVVAEGFLYLLEHTGDIKWGVALPDDRPDRNHGGPPTIADMDGDGQSEIGVAGATRYVVFRADGSVKWQKPTQDLSSTTTGSSVFDFEGDGSAEIVYGDELYLRIYRGSDGTVLFETTKSSGTLWELPVVVDVDADGNAEIVAVANNYGGGSENGIYVYGDLNDTWVSTRMIWNQHTYHVNNINEDGSIPLKESNSWQTHNSYRRNLQTLPGNPLAAPDLVASYLRVSPAPTQAAPVTYDLQADWSDLNNPNGVWSYNDSAGPVTTHQSDWNQFANNQPAWAYSSTLGAGLLVTWLKSISPAFDTLPGDIVTHTWDQFNGLPGRDPSSVTWTSPGNGIINITGHAWLTRDIGRAVDWNLSVRETSVSGGSLASGDLYHRANPFNLANGSGGAAVLNDLVVKQGDVITLSFPWTGTLGDFVGVALSIEFQPASMLTARIGNAGAFLAPSGVNVAFYNGNPSSGGIKLGVVKTAGPLVPGTFEDVSLPLLNLIATDIWVAADDDGTGKGQVSECNENNNIFNPLFAAPADLTIVALDDSGVVYDRQALTVGGTATATIGNQSLRPAIPPFDVLFFEDRNFNGTYDVASDGVLGIKTVEQTLPGGQTLIVSAQLTAFVLFPDNAIWAFVDSGNVIPESDEANNVLSSQSDCEYQPAGPPLLEFTSFVDFSNNVLSRTIIGFDNLATGNGVLSGNQFAADGLTIVQRNGLPMNVFRPGTQNGFTSLANANSAPNAISSTEGVGFASNSATDNFDFIFSSTSITAAGLWVGNIGGSGATTVQFMAANGSVIVQKVFGPNASTVPNIIFGPASGSDNRVFYGIVSDAPIERIRVIQPGGGEGITLDDIQFGSRTVPAPVPAPDLVAAFLRLSVSGQNTTYTIRIGNAGAVSAPANVSVAFYNGNPATAGTQVGLRQTTGPILPGAFEDVALVLQNPVADPWVAADDNGSGQGQVNECNEVNNRFSPPHFAQITGNIFNDLNGDAVRNDAPTLLVSANVKIRRYNAANGAFLDTFLTGVLPEVFTFAFGPDGDIYAADYTPGRILRYDGKTGAFKGQVVSDPRLRQVASPGNIAFDPDGNLLVSNNNIYDIDHLRLQPVMRFNRLTGESMGDFVPLGSGGLVAAGTIQMGPDGNLYVASIQGHDKILRYNGTTGAFIDTFATLPPHRSANMSFLGPSDLVFGPDGDLFLTDNGNLSDPTPGHSVMRFDGATGAFEGDFIPNRSGGALSTRGITFGSDGHLYVASTYSHEVLRYNGSTGFFIDRFIPAGRGGMAYPNDLTFASTLESILPGWTVYLDENHNGQRDATEKFAISDSEGNYSLAGLAPGTYAVAEELQLRWAQTSPVAPAHNVTLAPGQILAGLNFGNQQLTPDAKGEFRGTIFHDVNGDGTPDPEDYLRMIENRKLVIYLDQNQNNQRDPGERFLTVSDDVDPDPAGPSYNFTDLDPGSYTVTLEREPGWRQTTTGGIVNTLLLYAVGNGLGDGSSHLYRINNHATAPQAVAIGEAGVHLRDLAIDPIQGRAFAISDSSLYSVNLLTGAATLIGPTGVGPLTALAFSPGTLYAMGTGNQTLYRLDLATGAATALFNTGHSTTGDLAFDTDGSLYLTTGSQLVRLDPARSQATLVGSHGTDISGMVGLGIDFGGTLVGLRGSDTDGTAQLYSIHKATGAATLIANVAGADAFGACGLSFDAPRIVPDTSRRTYQITIAGNEVVFGVNFGVIPDAPANLSPVFTSTAPTSAAVGTLLRYDAKATDPNNDPLAFDLSLAPSGLAIGTTGIMVWQPRLDQLGTHDVILRVRDGKGGVALQAFQLTVSHNAAPQITSVPFGPAFTGVLYRYPVTAQDPESDTLTFQLLANPPGMVIDSNTGVLTWTPTSADIGTRLVHLRVADGKGGEATQSFNLPIVAATANQPPIFTSSPRNSIGLGDLYVYEIKATDPDNDPLTFLLVTGPNDMTLETPQLSTPGSRLLTWTPTGVQLGGPHSVILRVEDGRGGFALQEFTINVTQQTANSAPAISSTPPFSGSVNALYEYNPTASDADHDLLVWNLNSGPVGLSLDPQTGAIRWTPNAGQRGAHDIAISVMDPQGASASQGFRVTVGENGPPRISSIPLTTASEGEPYAYPVRASDPNGDPIAFTLAAAPSGMTINPNSGLIDWPSPQLGTHSIQILANDGRGGIGNQSYSLVVLPNVPNQPPSILSTPLTAATVGALYQYQLQASDPEAQPLTYQFQEKPAGMEVSPTGLIQWTPSSAQLGPHSVRILAVDHAGDAARQSFSVTVREINRPPVINNSPRTTAFAGVPYAFHLNVTDPDGDPILYTLTANPAGMTIDSLGRIAWTPPFSQLGTHRVDLIIRDIRGAGFTVGYNLNVIADTTPPQLALQSTANPVNLNSPVTVLVTASDNVALASIGLTIDGTPAALDSAGRATLTFTQIGLKHLIATATDTSGNSADTALDLLVIDLSDATAPIVAIHSPTNDQVITAPIDVIGTVTDNNLVGYKAEIANFADGEFRQIFTGTTTVQNGILGKLDPTLLQNDSYILRLTAEDAGGHIVSAETLFNVSGNLKIGNFRLSFVDLTIPVSGIPITIGRTYDTLDANRQGDFGYGWRLDLFDVDLRANTGLTGLEDVGIHQPYRNGTRIYVRLPDGRREAFTVRPKLGASIASGLVFTLARLVEIEFVPDRGVFSTLTLSRNFTLKLTQRGELLNPDGLPFNPASDLFQPLTFTLTTKEGVAFTVDPLTGECHSLKDRNNNQLTITHEGILSSTGKQVEFERDSTGRITAVIDPIGNRLIYDYNTAGNLTGVTDREANKTTFAYHTTIPHYLDRIIDPLGRTGARSEYDTFGRLVKVLDVNNKGVELIHDLNNSIEKVRDALGNETVLVYDTRGNVVTEINAEGGVTKRTYDLDNNTLSEAVELPGSPNLTTAFTYDGRGNRVTITDSVGKGSTATYGLLNKVQSITDAQGDTTVNAYDLNGNLIAIKNPEGHTVTLQYASFGMPQLISDALGKSRSLTYGTSGFLQSLVDPLGFGQDFQYNANGSQISSSFPWINPDDPTDVKLAFQSRSTYDANGRATKITDANNHEVSNTFDVFGNVVESVDQFNNITRNLYDTRNRLIETQFPDGTTVRTAYDELGRPAYVMDRWASNSEGQLPNGTQTLYDKVGRVRETRRYAQMEIRIDSLPSGAKMSTLATIGNLLSSQSYRHDAAGRIVAATNPENGEVAFTYDSRGRKRQITNALSNSTEFAYDDVGRPVLVRDPLGQVTRFQYDTTGRVRKGEFADGSEVEMIYDAAGRRVAEINQLGAERNFEYDALGRLVASILPETQDPENLGNLRRPRYEFERDHYGNLKVIRDPKGRETRFAYDEQNRQLSHQLPGGQIAGKEYDDFGRLASEIDFNGQVTRYKYDQLSRLVEKRFFDTLANSENGTPSSLVLLTFDGLGRQKSINDSRHGLTEYNYDADGRVIRIASPEGTVNYEFDSATGNRTRTFTEKTDVRYAYDQLGRLKTVAAHKLNGTVLPIARVTIYEYTPVGTRAAIKLPNGVTTRYFYNSLSHLVRLTHERANGDVFSSYDYTLRPDGRRLGVVERTFTPVGEIVANTSYTYDPLNRLTLESRSGPSAATGYTIRYTYDTVGNRLERIITLAASTLKTTYTYDSNDHLLSEIHVSTQTAATGAQVLYAANTRYAPRNPFAWAYYTFLTLPVALLLAISAPLLAAFAQRLSRLFFTLKFTVTRGDSAETSRSCPSLTLRCVSCHLAVLMAMSPASINSLGQEATAYDALSHPLTTGTWGVGGTITNYTYDPNGSLVRKTTSGLRQETIDYTYDGEKRLVSVTGTTIEAGQQVVALNEYSYSGYGRVRSESTRVVAGQAGATTTQKFLLDPENPTGFAQVLEEQDGDGDTHLSYVIGDDVIAQVCNADGGLESSYFGYDGHGSTRFVTDEVGVQGEFYGYDGYGGPLQFNPADARTSLLYAGEAFDTSINQYYLRARLYDQSLGRFTSVDPFFGAPSTPQSLHKYTYVHNDPVNFIDPSGRVTLTEVLIAASIGGLVTGLVNTALAKPGEGGKAFVAGFVGGFVGTAIAVALGPIVVGTGVPGSAAVGIVSFADAIWVGGLSGGVSSSLTQAVFNYETNQPILDGVAAAGLSGAFTGGIIGPFAVFLGHSQPYLQKLFGELLLPASAEVGSNFFVGLANLFK